MGKRRPYSLVLIGARKDAARQKYLQFLAGAADRESKIGTRGRRPASVEMGIEPFGMTLPTGVLAKASASVDALTAFAGNASVTARVRILPGTTRTGYTAAAAGTEFLKIGGLSPARVIRRVYTQATATPKKSDITGLTYGYRRSTSLSAPIGRENGTDTLTDALVELKADIETNDGQTQVFLKDEEV